MAINSLALPDESRHARRIYTGIGSRQAPPDILAYMHRLAQRLAALNYMLRSGAANGSDAAFEAGCLSVGGESEIWLPWTGFNNHADTGLYPTEAHMTMAASVHPAWGSLGKGPKALHGRNTGQVLGKDLATPSLFTVCYTLDGCESEATRKRDTGGTATAIVLSDRNQVPVFNLAKPDAKDRLIRHVFADCRTFHVDGTEPQKGEVFVFGSNLAGRHGKGSALVAKEKFGAIYGQGAGKQGQSYGVPTKDGRPGEYSLSDVRATLPLSVIKEEVDRFIEYAKQHESEQFFVVRLGCQLAAHTDADVAPLFAMAPLNCSFPDSWMPWLSNSARGVLVTPKSAPTQEALF